MTESGCVGHEPDAQSVVPDEVRHLGRCIGTEAWGQSLIHGPGRFHKSRREANHLAHFFKRHIRREVPMRPDLLRCRPAATETSSRRAVVKCPAERIEEMERGPMTDAGALPIEFAELAEDVFTAHGVPEVLGPQEDV